MALCGGVAKKISLFECPSENRLRRKCAIKRKKMKDSSKSDFSEEFKSQSQSLESLSKSFEDLTPTSSRPTSIGTSMAISFISKVSLSIPTPHYNYEKSNVLVAQDCWQKSHEFEDYNVIDSYEDSGYEYHDRNGHKNTNVICTASNKTTVNEKSGGKTFQKTLSLQNIGRSSQFSRHKSTRTLYESCENLLERLRKESYSNWDEISQSCSEISDSETESDDLKDDFKSKNTFDDDDDADTDCIDEPFYEEVEECKEKYEALLSKQNSSKEKSRKEIKSILSTKKLSDDNLPPTPPPLESLYSEPIYGQSGVPLSTTTWNSSTSATSQNSNSGGIYAWDDTNRSSGRNSNSNSNYDASCSSFYLGSVNNDSIEHRSLPTIPPNRISTMARTAGRKLAKKFMNIRKLSKTSLETFNSSTSNGSENGIINQEKSIESSPNGSQKSVRSANDGKNPGFRRSISRPSIPPPAPPPPPPNIHPANLSIKRTSHSQSQNKSHYQSHQAKPKPLENATTTNITRKDYSENENDDSDFYDSDSDLIRNFVSQVQPIYSMEEEPLYQYYTYGTSIEPESDYQPVIPKNLGLTLDMLVPNVGQRTLWCELTEVKASGILSILSDKQKQLQEAIFEILTSEVSYLKSLEVLITIFHKNLIDMLSEEETSALFGNVLDVRKAAKEFLNELLGKWEESWYIHNIGEIVNKNAKSRFSVYVEYCRNKPYQDKMLQKLKINNEEFCQSVRSIESNSQCQMLRMESFLMLPMQRITRLPLLINSVIQRTIHSKEKSTCEEALDNLTKLVIECNEAAREAQDEEETQSIVDRIDFPTRGILGQFLMKSEFMRNPFDKSNWTFGRKNRRTFYWLILFSNQLLLTKKKSNGRFQVIDSFTPVDSIIKPLPNLETITSTDFKHYFMLHFHKKESIIHFLASRTEQEILKWRDKFDRMREEQVLIKVEAIFLYEKQRQDELSFQPGDIILVHKILPDGWYRGTIEGTSNCGWFPGNYSVEY